MKKRVYLAGPVQGNEDHQEYRARLKKALGPLGIEPYDPTVSKKVTYRELDVETARKLISSDVQEARRADILIAYFPFPSVGAAIEAWECKKSGGKIIVICEMPNPSPWIVGLADLFFRSIDEFEKFLQQDGSKLSAE